MEQQLKSEALKSTKLMSSHGYSLTITGKIKTNLLPFGGNSPFLRLPRAILEISVNPKKAWRFVPAIHVQPLSQFSDLMPDYAPVLWC